MGPRLKNQSKELKLRQDFHWPRRIFHIVSGILIVVLSYYFKNRTQFLGFSALLILIEFSFELLRLRSVAVQAFAEKLFRGLMRQGEESRISGVPYYGLGCLVAFIIFPQPIAAAAVLYLAVGDPVASIFGRLAKRRLFPAEQNNFIQSFADKSLEGSVACFVACTLITGLCLLFLFERKLELGWFWLGSSLTGGLCASVAELLPLRTDDNLSIPLVGGALFWLYCSLTGIIPGLVI